MRFNDRREAGQRLADKLMTYATQKEVVVLALPRGGVPVAYEVAQRLKAPLDVFLVRKLGVPQQPELAFGAIASGNIQMLNPRIVKAYHISPETVEQVAAMEQQELQRREKTYRDARPAPDVSGKTVILIDDGLATGATVRAAAQALRLRKPGQLVVAVPVAAESACQAIKQEVDAIVCAVTPNPFYGVGKWYDDFSQTTDEEVQQLLAKAAVAATW
jgi:putative phosphoribosyl transferase